MQHLQLTTPMLNSPGTRLSALYSAYLPAMLYALLLLSLTISQANADPQQTGQKLVDKAREMRLWNNNEWLNLLHYNNEYNSFNSQVDDDRFFYASDGRTNPQAELLETVRHLFLTTEDDNRQTQCQFVARTAWLSEKLDINQGVLPEVHCSEYLEWRQLTRADSVTMIFPAYHLNSPSSMFGHTLLRLDNSSDTQSEWLSFAVNFGANINNDDNSLIYAYRGLAGGYPGSFITEPYYKKIQEYNRIEHRDIWEYELNLTPAETERMILHLWELKTINFDYYFFDENCSYRLLELLEVARPGIELTDEFILTAIPVDTVRAIETAGLIKATSYRPAQATEIQHIKQSLNDNQRKLAIQLSGDIAVINSDAFKQLSLLDQKKVIDLAYRFLRYQNTKTSRDSAIAKRSYQLLQKINAYAKDINIETTITTPYPPENGHKSKRASFSAGERLDNSYAEFALKMAFHDLEDNNNGFLQGAQINIGNLVMRAEDNVGLRLFRLDLVDIFSLTPRNDFFTPMSWKVYSGFERQLTNNKDQLTYHVTGGAGGTWEYLKNHQYYALAIARLEANKQLRNTLEPAIGFNTGLLSHFKNTTARLEISGEQFLDSVYRIRAQYTQNYAINTNHSIKFYARQQWQNDNTEFTDINLSYQYYF